jgi:hypothetical protein
MNSLASYHVSIARGGTALWDVDFETPNKFTIHQLVATSSQECAGLGTPAPPVCNSEVASNGNGIGYLRSCSDGSCTAWLTIDAGVALLLSDTDPITLPSWPLVLLQSLESPKIDSTSSSAIVISGGFDAVKVINDAETQSLGTSLAGGGCSNTDVYDNGTITSSATCVSNDTPFPTEAKVHVSLPDYSISQIDATVPDPSGSNEDVTLTFSGINGTTVSPVTSSQ